MDLQNYHDWIAERQQLLERIKELEAENAELKKWLGEDVVPVVHKPTAMQKLSAQEKVELFRSLYKGREDVFAKVTVEVVTNKRIAANRAKQFLDDFLFLWLISQSQPIQLLG